jgi:hypothetical protein
MGDLVESNREGRELLNGGAGFGQVSAVGARIKGDAEIMPQLFDLGLGFVQMSGDLLQVETVVLQIELEQFC